MASIPPRHSEANSAGHPARRSIARPSDPAQPDLARAASRLRRVRLASRQFLFLWMLENHGRSAARPDVSISGATNAQFPPVGNLPPDTGWSALYVGDVLDD